MTRGIVLGGEVPAATECAHERKIGDARDAAVRRLVHEFGACKTCDMAQLVGALLDATQARASEIVKRAAAEGWSAGMEARALDESVAEVAASVAAIRREREAALIEAASAEFVSMARQYLELGDRMAALSAQFAAALTADPPYSEG